MVRCTLRTRGCSPLSSARCARVFRGAAALRAAEYLRGNSRPFPPQWSSVLPNAMGPYSFAVTIFRSRILMRPHLFDRVEDGPSDSPTRDTSAHDPSAHDASARDPSARDSPARDSSARDSSARDPAARPAARAEDARMMVHRVADGAADDGRCGRKPKARDFACSIAES